MESQEKSEQTRPHLCRPAMPDFGSGLHTLVTATAWDSAPQIQPWLEVGPGPGTRLDGAAPNSSLFPPSPAGTSGVPAWPRNLEEGSRERRAGVGNKARACRRSVWHPAPGQLPSPGLRPPGDSISPTDSHFTAPPPSGG